VGPTTGRAVVVVSCVTFDPPYRPHPHNLVGKEGCKKGVCTLEIGKLFKICVYIYHHPSEWSVTLLNMCTANEDMTCEFSNLGIQCVKKKDIEDSLKIREEIRVDPFRSKS
jgi:Rel/ankyrin family protein